MCLNIEQEIELKDGRVIYKTNNGFNCWVKTKKGIVTKVSDSYYNKVKSNRLKKQI